MPDDKAQRTVTWTVPWNKNVGETPIKQGQRKLWTQTSPTVKWHLRPAYGIQPAPASRGAETASLILPNWKTALGWCLWDRKDKQTTTHTHTHTLSHAEHESHTQSTHNQPCTHIQIADTWMQLSLGSQSHVSMSKLSRLGEEMILYPWDKYCYGQSFLKWEQIGLFWHEAFKWNKRLP